MATNEAASLINDAVREQLVAAGAVDDDRIVHGVDGLRIGVGDVVMTRSNDRYSGVANRQLWTVTALHDDGRLHLLGPAAARGTERAEATISADYVREYLHLAYASTVHGVQGETVDIGDLLATDSTDAPSLYVGLTRSKYFRTLHMIGDLDSARDQYIAIAGRNRADLGLDQARETAAAEAALYAEAAVQRYQRPRARRSIADRVAAVVGQLDDHQQEPVDGEDQGEAFDDELSLDAPHQRDDPGQRLVGPRI